jgi:histidine triad (HIT) family protein
MAKESCLICQIISGRVPSKKVFEDDTILAVLDVNGANPGHCFVMPKEHYPIIEQVPDLEIGKIFNVANKISTSVFETLKTQGTNIFVANGIPAGQTVAHFMVNVIPRFEKDGINLQWEPKQLDEEEMSTVELKLKEQTKNIGGFEKEEKTEAIETEHVSKAPAADEDEEDDSYTRQMRRIP